MATERKEHLLSIATVPDSLIPQLFLSFSPQADPRLRGWSQASLNHRKKTETVFAPKSPAGSLVKYPKEAESLHKACT